VPPQPELEPLDFPAIDGFGRDDLAQAFEVFRRSADRLSLDGAALRPARPASAGLLAAGRAALAAGARNDGCADAADFFKAWFQPFRVVGQGFGQGLGQGLGQGFVTAYYEPEIEARRIPNRDFCAPVLARPPDLVTLNEQPLIGEDGAALTSARMRKGGGLAPYPDRRAIEDDPAFARGEPLAYVRDCVELFSMQVQGSARLRFPDGDAALLTYDGRNGHPYTSIGRLLVERGVVSARAMSLETLKAAVRAMGQGPGEAGRLLMQENRSYVFFRLDMSPERLSGPIGGQGCVLTPMRSIAVDRAIWSYGLPFWISTRIPWEGESATRFERLMIAQDTGSAILGPARADLYFGVGARAGALAGGVRHGAEVIVLLPRDAAGAP
jgi:membrane-bound lytic murein transglycosylase A